MTTNALHGELYIAMWHPDKRLLGYTIHKHMKVLCACLNKLQVQHVCMRAESCNARGLPEEEGPGQLDPCEARVRQTPFLPFAVGAASHAGKKGDGSLEESLLFEWRGGLCSTHVHGHVASHGHCMHAWCARQKLM